MGLRIPVQLSAINLRGSCTRAGIQSTAAGGGVWLHHGRRVGEQLYE